MSYAQAYRARGSENRGESPRSENREVPLDTILRNEKQFGAALRRIRRHAGLSQQQLGDRAGLRQATISSLESGARATRLSTVVAVLAALDQELVLRARTRSPERRMEDLF